MNNLECLMHVYSTCPSTLYQGFNKQWGEDIVFSEELRHCMPTYCACSVLHIYFKIVYLKYLTKTWAKGFWYINSEWRDFEAQTADS